MEESREMKRRRRIRPGRPLRFPRLCVKRPKVFLATCLRVLEDFDNYVGDVGRPPGYRLSVACVTDELEHVVLARRKW